MKAGKHCCWDATAFKKAFARVGFHLQSEKQKMMQSRNFSKARFGRWFKEKIRHAGGDR
jgi:hypothetical protein